NSSEMDLPSSVQSPEHPVPVCTVLVVKPPSGLSESRVIVDAPTMSPEKSYAHVVLPAHAPGSIVLERSVPAAATPLHMPMPSATAVVATATFRSADRRSPALPRCFVSRSASWSPYMHRPSHQPRTTRWFGEVFGNARRRAMCQVQRFRSSLLN